MAPGIPESRDSNTHACHLQAARDFNLYEAKIKNLHIRPRAKHRGCQPVSPVRVLHLAIVNVCQPANECGKKNCVEEIKALAAVCVAAYKGAGQRTSRVLLRWGSPDSIP